MKTDIRKMIAEAYELKGLLLLADNRGADTPEYVFTAIGEKLDRLQMLLGEREGDEGEEVYKPQNTRFQAMLKYDDGTNVPSPSQTDVIEVDENEIKTYVLWDEVEFKRSYVNLPAGVDSFPYLVLRMPNKLLSKDNVNGLSVSRIIIEPIHE